MVGLELRFLAGRFHGNAWHHAHNEGIPEWPPSPWRLLRALVSAAYAEELPPGDVAPIIEKLSALPRYRLPLAVEAHTRHYMPDTDDAAHKRKKVFDTFVAIEGGADAPEPVTVVWPTRLSPPEQELLVRLCRRVTYLGRAESWAELRVVDVEEAEHDGWDSWPDELAQGAGTTNLLAPASPESLAERPTEQTRPSPKRGQKSPVTLWEVLTFEGERYRKEGWSSVPGTRLARYVFRRPPFVTVPLAGRARRRKNRPTLARFAIRSSVRPKMEEALAITDRLRVALMSRSARNSGDPAPVFSGHGHDRGHRHSLYLACDDDGDGFIDHLMVHARAGFAEEDVIVLQSLRRVWGKGGNDLGLILVGLGAAHDFGGTALPRTPTLGTSRVWESVTPFVPTRHPKLVRGTQVDGLPDQIRRACEQFLGVSPKAIMSLGDGAFWLRFRRRRLRGGGSRGPDWAVGVRLVFDEPVQGPIALGYGAHFGLGLFAACPEPADP